MRRALGWLVATLLLVAAPARASDELALVGPGGEAITFEAPAPGELLLIHFWASWCPSCIDDLAALEKARSACPSSRLQIYAVNVGEAADLVEAFVRSHDLRLSVLRDPHGRTWREVDGRGLPANLFWTATGRKTEVGPKSLEQWRKRLDAFDCR